MTKLKIKTPKSAGSLIFLARTWYTLGTVHILWVTTQTQLFLTPPQKINQEQGSGLSSLGRIIRRLCLRWWCPRVFAQKWQIFPRCCSAHCPVDRSWCAQRCCDGAATESLLRWRCADQLRRAHSARRVRDAAGADAAATELMLRAALLRRSCDGVAAAMELRRPAPSRSFCALRLDATRRMRPAFIFPRVDLNFNARGPQS